MIVTLHKFFSISIYLSTAVFIVLLRHFWSRSSMDRIVDSGSIDWSSSLHGITTKKPKDRVFGLFGFSDKILVFSEGGKLLTNHLSLKTAPPYFQAAYLLLHR